jgi:formylglycine-generating enzyme
VKRKVLGLASIAVLAACGIDAIGEMIVAPLPDDPLREDGGADATDAAQPSEDASDASTATDADADAPVKTGCPSGMVTIPDAGYCIDATEVTEARWKAFLAADAGTSTLPAACAYKTALAAGSARGATFPVSDVDWCDAFAFCAWADKRLCATAEWTTACNGGTSRIYPYGDVFDDQKCNGGPLDAATMPGAFAECVGPIPGIVDMSGNMDEWDVTCASQAGGADLCQTRGGDWKNDSAGELMCASVFARPRDTILNYVGFRCCK